MERAQWCPRAERKQASKTMKRLKLARWRRKVGARKWTSDVLTNLEHWSPNGSDSSFETHHPDIETISTVSNCFHWVVRTSTISWQDLSHTDFIYTQLDPFSVHLIGILSPASFSTPPPLLSSRLIQSTISSLSLSSNNYVIAFLIPSLAAYVQPQHHILALQLFVWTVSIINRASSHLNPTLISALTHDFPTLLCTLRITPLRDLPQPWNLKVEFNYRVLAYYHKLQPFLREKLSLHILLQSTFSRLSIH